MVAHALQLRAETVTRFPFWAMHKTSSWPVWTSISNDMIDFYSADFKTNEKKIMQGLDELAK